MLRDPRTAASVKLQRDIKEDLDWQLRSGRNAQMLRRICEARYVVNGGCVRR